MLSAVLDGRGACGLLDVLMDAYVLADVVGIIFFSKFSCNKFHAPVIIFF